jgi:hypothetical protein
MVSSGQAFLEIVLFNGEGAYWKKFDIGVAIRFTSIRRASGNPMNQSTSSNRPYVEQLPPVKTSQTFARLMQPKEVNEAIKYYPPEVRIRVGGHWILCGDVSSQMFQLLKKGSSDFYPARLSGFTTDNGNRYAVVTHQIDTHQHRFVLCLSDPPVREFMAATAKDKVSFMLGDDNQPDALVLESPFKPSQFVPLLATSHSWSVEARKEALLELPLVHAVMANPLQVPTLIPGIPVREVNVSLLLPSILDETLRIAMRNAARK